VEGEHTPPHILSQPHAQPVEMTTDVMCGHEGGNVGKTSVPCHTSVPH